MPLSYPSTVQIVEAVRTFLEKDILTSASGRQAFDTKVAINALLIVERELNNGSQLDSDERKRLVTLLGHEGALEDMNEDLAKAISDGSMGTGDSELIDHLYKSVMGKLSIDNPRYSTYKRLKEKGK